MKLFKGSLLEEVRAQHCNENDDDDDLMTSIKNYFNMFNSGVVEKMRRVFNVLCATEKTKNRALLRNSFCILIICTMMRTVKITAAILVIC